MPSKHRSLHIMIKRIYVQLLTIIALVCYAGSLSAENYSLSPSIIDRKVYVSLSEASAKCPVLVTNYGTSSIQSFEYTLSFEGKIIQTKAYTFPKPLGKMEGATVEIDFPPHRQISKTMLELSITKVNGQPNSASVKSITIPRQTVKKVPHRRIVVEEYTRMSCQYCPRGLALMENLLNTYPNDVIGIVVHTSRDALHCQDYASKARDYSSRPTLVMNRNLFLPYHKATAEFEEEKAKGADMDIEISAKWDTEKENITVIPRVTFCLDREDAPYGFAYVLIEDGMSHPSWAQANAYSGRTVDSGITKELDFFINSPYELRGYVNNSVAIAAEWVTYPLRGYIQTPVIANKTQSHEYVFRNISRKTIIQDKAKLSVCVLLINLQTGQIENAAKCSIDDATATSIIPLSQNQSNTREVARYTIDGCRILTPQKGINIVKYSDGSVRKEMVTE